MNINAEDVKKKLDEYLANVTLEQLNKDLEKAGMGFYAQAEPVAEVPCSAGLSCQNDYLIAKMMDNLMKTSIDKEQFRPIAKEVFKLRNKIFDRLLKINPESNW